MYSCAIALLVKASHFLFLMKCEVNEDWPQAMQSVYTVGVKPPTLYWPVFQFPTPVIYSIYSTELFLNNVICKKCRS